MKTKVLERLKPKAASLGFTKKELEGVSDLITRNLQEDASDESVDAEIEKAIQFLEMSQSMANRVINATISKTKTQKGAEANDPESEAEQPDDEPAWFKKYREQQEQRLFQLENAKIAESRRERFEKSLTGLLPKQKEDKLKDFDRMNFKDEEDFNNYLEEKSAMVSAINQELANEGLDKMSAPPAGTTAKSSTDEFVEKMVQLNKNAE